MLRTLILMMTAAVSCASLPAYRPDSAQVLTSRDGVRVEMVQAAEGDEFFIRFTGVDSEIDGYVLRHTRGDHGSYTRWSTQVRGNDRTMLVLEDDDNQFRHQVRGDRPVRMEIDAEASRTLDVEALLSDHVRQTNDGSIARLQRFDRARKEREVKESFRPSADEVKERCGVDLAWTIDWSTIADEQLQTLSIPGHCYHGSRALREICQWREGRRSIREDVRRLECGIATTTSTFTLADGTLRWSFSPEEAGLYDLALEQLMNQVPWGAGHLADRVQHEAIVLCADDNGHIVGQEPSHVIYYDGKDWLSARPVHSAPDWFRDPRFYRADAPITLRLDRRMHSQLELAKDRSTCTLHCGSQAIELRVLSEEEKAKVLPLPAPLKPAPVPRRPYGLARDRRGNYYFVDVGGAEDARDFRVYVGVKGAMTRQKMKNVVTDSEGDIFVTGSGELRLILDKEESAWVQGGRETPLKNLALEDNLNVVYNQLGVYIGQPYGTPCDHM